MSINTLLQSTWSQASFVQLLYNVTAAELSFWKSGGSTAYSVYLKLSFLKVMCLRLESPTSDLITVTESHRIKNHTLLTPNWSAEQQEPLTALTPGCADIRSRTAVGPEERTVRLVCVYS